MTQQEFQAAVLARFDDAQEHENEAHAAIGARIDRLEKSLVARSDYHNEQLRNVTRTVDRLFEMMTHGQTVADNPA